MNTLQVKGADPRCPSTAGYQAHRKRGEAPCDACRDARNAERRAQAAAKPKQSRPDTTMTRFFAKVTDAGFESCWEWTAYRDANGYGRFSRGRGQMDMAHRVAFELLRSEIPAGLQLDHLCRNRACVNPWHLEPVTPLVNSRRGTAGEVNAARQRAITHCPRGHGYSPANTKVRTNGARRCRACAREAQKAKYTANPEKYREISARSKARRKEAA